MDGDRLETEFHNYRQRTDKEKEKREEKKETKSIFIQSCSALNHFGEKNIGKYS